MMSLAGCGGSSTCTAFTYSNWGTCQSDGGQTRTVLTSSPTGCANGSPMLTQSCSATADGAALYQAKCFSCHDTLATTPLKAKHPTMTTYTAAHDMQTYGLTTTQLQAIFTAIGS
jgi:hypothetical protein